MRAGRLRERITLQRWETTGVDAFNEPVGDWVDVATVSASKADVSDGEKVRAAQTGATLTSRFQIRASSQLAGMGAAWRLIHHGRFGDAAYAISGVKDLLSASGAPEGKEITAAAEADGVSP